MRPEQAAAELAKHARALHDVPAADAALERVAREIAAAVKGQAARAGHSVGIRVLTKSGGVRFTVTGYRAPVYRNVIKAELERRMPDIKAEIRTQARRKS